MSPILSVAVFIKHTFLEMLPPTIYFFVTFNIIVLTTSMVLQEFEIHISRYAEATVLALIVGKVVIVVNKVKYIRWLDDRPLVYSVFFKASFYTFFSFLFRLLKSWIPGLIETATITGANQHLMDTVIWRFFFMAQIWIFILFIAYFTFVALIEVFDITTRDLITVFFRVRPATRIDRA